MFQRRSPHGASPYRVVVETDDPALAISDFVCFAEAGFDVLVCPGPSEEHPCPALRGEVCDALVGADVVFNAVRDTASQRSVVDAVRAVAPALPMVVNVAPGMAADLPAGCIPLSSAVSINGQTDAVRRAAVSRH